MSFSRYILEIRNKDASTRCSLRSNVPTNNGSAPFQIPEIIVAEEVGGAFKISDSRFLQNPNFPAASIVRNFKIWNIKHMARW